jgi:hypothetical protein
MAAYEGLDRALATESDAEVQEEIRLALEECSDARRPTTEDELLRPQV